MNFIKNCQFTDVCCDAFEYYKAERNSSCSKHNKEAGNSCCKQATGKEKDC